MTKISIRQPGYLPYMGFFKKIQNCDFFVYLDDVQYERSGWDNRNKIKTSDGTILLTVPVYNKFGQKLNEVKISHETNWNEKHIKAIEMNYNKAPYFDSYWNSLKEILKKKYIKLLDLNMAIIEYVNKELEINTKSICSSELKIDLVGSERLLEICKKLGGKTYISGEMGHEYLNTEIFNKEQIDVLYENFQHPIYSQLYGKFIPNLSILDLLFNEGENSKKILENSKNLS